MRVLGRRQPSSTSHLGPRRNRLPSATDTSPREDPIGQVFQVPRPTSLETKKRLDWSSQRMDHNNLFKNSLDVYLVIQDIRCGKAKLNSNEGIEMPRPSFVLTTKQSGGAIQINIEMLSSQATALFRPSNIKVFTFVETLATHNNTKVLRTHFIPYDYRNYDVRVCYGYLRGAGHIHYGDKTTRRVSLRQSLHCKSQHFRWEGVKKTREAVEQYETDNNVSMRRKDQHTTSIYGQEGYDGI
ncbi:hypothetical protein Hypma_006149 [Hypsizygus marmoreus]|uniref:Uncharacterized protein n=1 Tax=Hypsizygus marmoreus TaxID=39966 RepID=A0A369JWC0_HYPMA|nr:hypothetical protein Hypma_006149 [Hypsizygus marmoreus]